MIIKLLIIISGMNFYLTDYFSVVKSLINSLLMGLALYKQLSKGVKAGFNYTVKTLVVQKPTRDCDKRK